MAHPSAQHPVAVQEIAQSPGEGDHPLAYRHLWEHLFDEARGVWELRPLVWRGSPESVVVPAVRMIHRAIDIEIGLRHAIETRALIAIGIFATF